MIPIEYYKIVYFTLISIVLIVFFLPKIIIEPLVSSNSKLYQFFVFIILVFTIGFIGLRDPWGLERFFGDTITYSEYYEAIRLGYLTEFTVDYGFFFFMKMCTYLFTLSQFYVICAMIYVLLPFVSFKKWFGNKVIYVLLVYVLSFSFLPFGINGVRNGLASAIFIFAIGFTEKKWLMYSLFVLSISFHKSMVLPFLTFQMVYIIKNPKYYLYFWLLSIPLSFFFSKSLVSFAEFIFENDSLIQDSRSSTYFSKDTIVTQVSGVFRIDFILYSSIAVIIGYWSIVKKSFNNKLYHKIYGTYVLANAIWILLIYVPFTNRVAYLSWFLMPIVLTFPFVTKVRFTKHNKKYLIYIIYGTLAFTLLMEII
jgi:hypothetical protein